MPRAALTLFAALLTLAGCSSDASGPSGGIDLSGNWSGTARLPNAYSTSMSLQQAGASASGTMRVSGSFIDRPIIGQVTGADRTYTWAVNKDCEVWHGTLLLDAAGTALSGPVVIDRTGCQPARSNGSGQITLTRQ